MSSQQSVVGDSSPPREARRSLVHAEEKSLFNIPQSEATGQKSTVFEGAGGQQPLPPQEQFQLDWQAKLEQLQNQHKQESLQQQKEHIEQLRLLQAQIMNELGINSSTTSEQVPSSSIRVSDTPSLKASHSTDLIRESSSSPLFAVKGEIISEKSKGLTRAHSMSDPQLSLMTTTSQTLSPSSSPVKAHSTDHTLVSSPTCIITKSPSQPILEGGTERNSQNQAERVDSSDFSAGHSFGFSHSGAPPITTTSSGAALVRTSTTESLDQSSAATSIEASPIKLDEDRMKLTLSDIDDDSDQSLSVIPRMSPQLKSTVGAGSISSSVSPSKPPQRRLVWTESNQQSSTATPSLAISTPATKLTVKTSPMVQSIVAPTPVYPAIQLSPMYSSAAASPHSIRLSPASANVTLTSPSTFNRSSVMNESLSRATLMEKHKKHMDDLKLYYESELLQLKKKLGKLESERTDPSSTSARRSLSPMSSSFSSTQRSPLPTTPRQSRQMYFPSSLMKGRGARTPTSTGDGNSSGGDRSPSPGPVVASSMVNESEIWMLQSENARLKGECSELRARLDQDQREKHTLEEQVKRLKEHTLDWQGRLEASERMVSVLQERLESTRSQLYDQDKLVEQLRSDLQVAAEELQYWKEQRTQDLEKLEQLFDEFEVLQQENQDMRLANSQLHSQLEEVHQEADTYKTSLNKYQTLESQYKSTIRELEDEVRHLQHVNNRLHSMGTHYQLGVYGSPYSQPDERKVHHSPRSSSHTPSSTSHHLQSSTSTPPQSSNTAGRRDTPTTSVSKVPLTRRKWLESSIPGLIFGGGGEEERGQSASGKEPAISGDNHEGQSSMRSQPAVPSSRSRVPAMVNFSSGAPSRSPRKRQPSSSPKRPDSDPNGPSEQQQSPVMKAVQKVVLGEEGDGRENPTNHVSDQKWYEGGGDLAESALKAVRQGNVITTNERSYPSPAASRKKWTTKAKESSIEERVKKHMQIVSEAEQKLATLQKEKEKLESSLLKTPRTGTRVTRQSKQTKLETERLLEEVVKEIGSVRMVLRRHHALKK